MVATTGRVMEQYQTGVQTRRVSELAEAAPESFVRLHPETAQRAGVVEGQRTRVRSERGTAVVKARVDSSIRPDTVFLPIHYGEQGCANLLTSAVVDPRSGIPEFKVASVTLSAAEEVAE
nr:molybdopterin dinucleotide binding domain-containing protein [Actinopolyspora sp. BKK2]